SAFPRSADPILTDRLVREVPLPDLSRCSKRRAQVALLFTRLPRRCGRAPAVRGTKRYGVSAHSPLMFAVRITLPHFSVYSTMNLANSVGELTNGSAPKSTSRALNVGSARAAFTCLLRIAMISGGVPAGAAIPSQLLAS